MKPSPNQSIQSRQSSDTKMVDIAGEEDHQKLHSKK